MSAKEWVEGKIRTEMKSLVESNPMALLLQKELVSFATMGYMLGFYRGKTFQPVPEAFLKS